MKKKFVIFDCDGVLVDTEIVAAHVMRNILEGYNIEIPLAPYIRAYSGKTFKHIFQDFIQSEQLPSHLDVDDLIEQAEAEVALQLKPITGVIAALEQIALPKAVVSNSKASHVHDALDKIGATLFF